MAVKKIIRRLGEELERLGKTTVEQVTGTGEYDLKKDDSKILPPEEKQKIEAHQMAALAKINREIEEIRKKKEQKPPQEEQKKLMKKQEEKKKQHDKWAALKAILKTREGTGESKKYGSG